MKKPKDNKATGNYSEFGSKADTKKSTEEIWDLLFSCFPSDMENFDLMTHYQAYRLLKKFCKKLEELKKITMKKNKDNKKKKCVHHWKHATTSRLNREFDNEIITILYCEKCGELKESSCFIY